MGRLLNAIIGILLLLIVLALAIRYIEKTAEDSIYKNDSIFKKR